jgi:hypothetical protein
MVAIVTKPNGRKVNVRNMGYLLRHWQTIQSFMVTETNINDRDCCLRAEFSDGTTFEIEFNNMQVLWYFLHHSVFFGLSVNWFGRSYEIKRKKH